MGLRIISRFCTNRQKMYVWSKQKVYTRAQSTALFQLSITAIDSDQQADLTNLTTDR